MRAVLHSVVVVGCAGLLGGCIDRYLDPPDVRAPTVALFDPARGVLPFPHDALLLSSDDGTVDVPVGDDAPASDPRRALNTLDGFGLTGTIEIPFSRPLDPSSVVVGDNVRVFLGVTGDEVEAGRVAVVVDAAGTSLLVVPLQPWPEGETVVVIVTDGVRDEDDAAVEADRVFALARSENALVDKDGRAVRAGLISDEDARALEPLRALTSLSCTPARLRGIAVERLVMCLPVTTQTALDDVKALDRVAAAAHAAGSDDLRVLPVPLTSTAALGLGGAADVHLGAVRLTRFVPRDHPLDGAVAREVDGVPVAAGSDVVPLVVTAPRARSGPLPVVVFQHGVTRDRTDALLVADAFAAAAGGGAIVVAADLPLHGLTGDPAHVFAALNPALDDDAEAWQAPLFEGLRPRERTLDLDLVDNGDGSAGSDGAVDPSGTHFFNFASLLTARDHLRTAVVDVRALARAARDIDVDGDGVRDGDGRVFFVGHSLGAIVGASACALDGNDDAEDRVFSGCVLVNPGAQLAPLLRGSETFSPLLLSKLAAAGVTGDDVDEFVGVAQIVLDGADPWLTAPLLRASRAPLLVVDVKGDAVIPERVSRAPLAGGLPFLESLGLATAGEDRAADVAQRVRVRFARGDHTSLLSPAAPDVTAALQKLVAGFVASGGRAVDVEPGLVDGGF